MNTEGFDNSHTGSFTVMLLAATVVVCAGIKLAAPVLVPIVLGVFIATVDVPMVLWLQRRKLPPALAVTLALFADAVMLAGFSSLLVVSATRLAARLPLYMDQLRISEEKFSEWLGGLGVSIDVHEVLEPGAVFGTVAALLTDLVAVLTDLVLALIIAAFLLFRWVRLGRRQGKALALRTERVRNAVREMYRYIAVKTATSMITATLIGLWLWTVDADLPILFGLLAFLLNFIPTLGSFVAAAPAIAVAALQYGWGHAGLVALGYALVNLGVGNVIEPRVMGRALGLWPLVVLLSVLFWGWLLGVIGAVLSALLTQTVKVFLLSTPDLHPVGLALGPTSGTHIRDGDEDDLVEEAMPQTAGAHRRSSHAR